MKIPKYPLLISLLVLFFSFTAYFHLYDYKSDYWLHASVIQELANSPLKNLQFQLFSTTHQFGPVPYFYQPYTWSLAMIKKSVGMSPLDLLKLMGLFNLILFATGLHLFLKEYFSDSELSLYMLPIMLFFWGKSWDFSGAYDIGGLILNLSNPYSFAISLGYFALYFFIKYLKNGKIIHGIVLTMLLPTIVLVNLLPGYFTLATMALIFAMGKKIQARQIALLIGLALTSFFLVANWPYFSFLGLLKDGFSLQQIFNPAYYYIEHLSRLGPALLGLPIIIDAAIKRRHPFVVYGFILFLLSYLLAFALKIPIGWRLIFFIAFFLHLGIALFVRKKLPSLGKAFVIRRDNWSSTLLVTVFVGCLCYQTVSITAKELGFRSFKETLDFVRNNEKRGSGFEKRFQFLTRYISPNEIILSDQDTSLIIPAFGGRPVSYQEGYEIYDPLIKGFNEHQEDMRVFFNSETPSQKRLEIINKYKVKYVLWNSEKVLNQPPDDLKKWGTPLYEKNTLTLIKIISDNSEKVL